MKRLIIIIVAALFVLIPLSASGIEMIAVKGVEDAKSRHDVSITIDNGSLAAEAAEQDKNVNYPTQRDILYRIGL